MSKFVIYRDAAGEYRWRLVADNGAVIATPGEGFERKADCENNISLVRGASHAPVEYEDE